MKTLITFCLGILVAQTAMAQTLHCRASFDGRSHEQPQASNLVFTGTSDILGTPINEYTTQISGVNFYAHESAGTVTLQIESERDDVHVISGDFPVGMKKVSVQASSWKSWGEGNFAEIHCNE